MTVLAPTHFSLGYVKSTDNRREPTCTKFYSVILNGRGQSLVDATYRSPGYTSNASGAWRK